MINKPGVLTATLTISLMLILSGCVSEANYRTVPEKTWNQLSASQKQLIINDAYSKSSFANDGGA